MVTWKRTLELCTANLIQVIIEIAAIYPLLVLLDAYWLSSGHPVILAFWLLALAGVGSVIRQPSAIQQKVICSVPYLLLGVFAGYQLGMSIGSHGWIISIIGSVMAGFRGLMIAAETNRERLFPIRVQIMMLGIAWIIYIAAGRSEGMYDVRSSIYGAGALTLFAILFRFGKIQVSYISQDEGFSLNALRAVMRRSRRWIWLVVILIAVVGGSNQLSAWLYQLWTKLIAWMAPDAPPPPQMPTESFTPPTMTPLELPESDSAPMNSFWLEKIAQIAILLALSAFIGWIGWLIYRLIRKYAPRLYRWLSAFWEIQTNSAVEESDAYTDEMERIDENDKPVRRRSVWGKRSIPEAPAERVRYHYRQMLQRAERRSGSFPVSDTPSRIISKIDPNSSLLSRLIDLYHRTRYGQHTITDEEVRDWEKDADQNKSYINH